MPEGHHAPSGWQHSDCIHATAARTHQTAALLLSWFPITSYHITWPPCRRSWSSCVLTMPTWRGSPRLLKRHSYFLFHCCLLLEPPHGSASFCLLSGFSPSKCIQAKGSALLASIADVGLGDCPDQCSQPVLGSLFPSLCHKVPCLSFPHYFFGLSCC